MYSGCQTRVLPYLCVYIDFFVYIHVHVASSVGLLRQYPGAGVQCGCLIDSSRTGGSLSVDEGDGTDVYDYYSYYSIKNNNTQCKETERVVK